MNNFAEAARDMAHIFHHACFPKTTVLIPVEFPDGVIRDTSVFKSTIQASEQSTVNTKTDGFAEAVERSLVDTELRDEFEAFRVLSKEEQRNEVKKWRTLVDRGL